MNKANKWLNILLPILSVLSIVLIWTVASAIVKSEYILPTVGQTLTQLGKLLTTAEFYRAFISTLLRSLIAFSISYLLASIFAVLSYKFYVAEKIITPIISIIRALPTIAIVLLLLFWTNSKVAPVVVTMLVVLPTLYTNWLNALGGVDNELINMCKVFGVSKKDTFKKVVFPAVLPQMLTSVGAGISLNLKLMVAAEVLSATAYSLGYLLNTSKVYFEIANMIAIVCVTVVTGLIIELTFNFISKKVGKWR